MIASLALEAENRQPVVASMLLEEIERAELHAPDTMPPGHVMLNSKVTFIDDKMRAARTVQLVLPAHANIAEDRISIVTPMGAALYGLAEGNSISWPDLEGHERQIRIVKVEAPAGEL
jgi:regulator of nucleoside diphosphate kinase